jgi:hypothetical protein
MHESISSPYCCHSAATLPAALVEETDACFIVRDSNKQALAYVYFDDEAGRRSAAKLLTARRGAADSGCPGSLPRATNHLTFATPTDEGERSRQQAKAKRYGH